MIKNKINIPEKMVFLLGIFSTFELTRIFGITFFSCILVIFTIYMIMYSKKIYIKKQNKYLGIYLGIVSISELMIFTIQLKNRSEWITSSIKKYILLIFLICSLFFILKMKNGKEIFIKGLYYSCLIEMIWCYLQLALYLFAGLDLNMKLFGVSHISSTNGQLVLSGLNSNAGILASSLFFLILIEKKWTIKLLSLILFFISGTSTMIICGVVILFITGVHYLYVKNINKKSNIKIKYFLFFSLVLIVGACLIIFNPEIFQSLIQSFERLFDRLENARKANFTDGSTFTHSRYYTSIYYVIKNSNIINVLLGNGIDCAGVPFVRLYRQYPDLIYVPESDPITFLYNYGIIGFVFIYSVIFHVIFKGRKIDWRYVAFFISIIVGGIFYGMYLNWVFLVTWICVDSIYENKSIFES